MIKNLGIVVLLLAPSPLVADQRPNIVWIVSEDHGPHMGCYGDSFATTPNVDGLAARGLRYTHCWSNAPVCAPARTTLITGLYATSSGGEPMRSMVPLPRGQHLYPELLRQAGYYCTNNAKEDYNIQKPGKVWDESSRNAHWKKRPVGTPFFAVFNSEKSHESKIRVRPHKLVHDPARVRIPAYHPDTPEVRQDWAQYYDVVTEADADAGVRLRELADAGLMEDTIIFYYGDHGSGMPRSKRWPYNSGLHVPLVVYIPEKFQDLRPADYAPGQSSDRLVSFVDFAPTLLSLAGVQPPEWMQGHAFLGKFITPPQPFLYGFRGRMDERYDLVRSVTDGHFVYVRQYLPHVIYGQHIDYMFQTPTTRVWKQLHDLGKLTPEQDAFWNRKPAEELYDLQTDPDEVHNLANSVSHRQIRDRLRAAQHDHVLKIRDVGFLPEGERFRRANGDSIYDLGRDPNRYPLERILEAADLASMMSPDAVPQLKRDLKSDDNAVRYWGVLGLQMRGSAAVMSANDELHQALTDQSAFVEIAAAQALASAGGSGDLELALPHLVRLANWTKNDVFVSMAALNALDAIGERAATVEAAIQMLPAAGPTPDARYNDYVPRLLQALQAKNKH
ncbi:MAG: sulfatase [Planctomycetes bacterium]|nr:sulfatase [Planctomycetota bacterium]